jgi:uncharacterized membrane protein YwaF
MMPKHWYELTSSLLVAAGIILATFVAKRVDGSGFVVLAAPLMMALTVVGADMLNSRLRGGSPRPSWGALIMGAAVLLSSWILITRDPGLVKTMLPLTGTTSWVVLLSRAEDRRKICKEHVS